MSWKIREEFKHSSDPYMQQKYFKGSSQSSSSTDTYTPEQEEYFNNLLGGAQDWLSQGGLVGQGGSQDSNIAGALGAMGGRYMDVLTGDGDRQSLNQAKLANADAAQTNFDRNTMTSLNSGAQQAGNTGGSRAGIAAGLAASDMQSQVGQQNSQLEHQWQSEQMANKNNAAQGMLGLAGGLQAFGDSQAAHSDQAQYLQSLMAFKDLISGNMGGTSTSDGTSSTGGGGFGNTLGGLGALAGGIGKMMSDKDLKKNIKKTGTAETANGKEVNAYEWEWNDKAKKAKGLTGKSKGVLAQELEKKDPSAVSVDPESGFKQVDYSGVKKKKSKGGK